MSTRNPQFSIPQSRRAKAPEFRVPELRLYDDEIIADNFCGGGGASLGLEHALGRGPTLAVNHDAQAIALHRANHPNTKHYTESVYDVDPVKATGGKKVGLAWFSPDCTFHSRARGGKPFRDRNKARRRRGLAWVAVKWAAQVQPRVIIIENGKAHLEVSRSHGRAGYQWIRAARAP